MVAPYARDMSNVLVSSPQAGVTQLTLNRPEKLNAMNVELMENRTQILSSFTEDQREAMTAFLAKRPPEFEGR